MAKLISGQWRIEALRRSLPAYIRRRALRAAYGRKRRGWRPAQ